MPRWIKGLAFAGGLAVLAGLAAFFAGPPLIHAHHRARTADAEIAARGQRYDFLSSAELSATGSGARQNAGCAPETTRNAIEPAPVAGTMPGKTSRTLMFGRKKILRLQRHEYQERFEALRAKWPEGYPDHAGSVQEALVIAAGVLHAIFDRNGGNGWDEAADGEHLELLREQLLAFGDFTREEKDRLAWALAEILECGRELEREGESARDATGGLEVVKARVVDWVLAHPEEIPLREDDDYIGHD